ncbi:MAG: sigma-70 family RNA polymerase sigma factor [Actinomycetota bacterium]
MHDAELVDRIRSGDQQAWNELVDRHSGLLWRLARSVVNDDAAASDAMQTAWLRLLQYIDRIADPSAVRAWLATTTRREAIALSKSMARQQASDPLEWSFDEPTPAADDPSSKAAEAEQRDVVLAEFATLSEKCRQLLTLHAHKIAYDVIADTMDMPVGSIGPTKARCLETLRTSPAIRRLEMV